MIYYDTASLLSTVSTLMATDDNATFEQREITPRIALHGIVYIYMHVHNIYMLHSFSPKKWMSCKNEYRWYLSCVLTFSRLYKVTCKKKLACKILLKWIYNYTINFIQVLKNHKLSGLSKVITRGRLHVMSHRYIVHMI